MKSLIRLIMDRSMSVVETEPRHAELQRLIDLNNAMRAMGIRRIGEQEASDWVGRARVRK